MYLLSGKILTNIAVYNSCGLFKTCLENCFTIDFYIQTKACAKQKT